MLDAIVARRREEVAQSKLDRPLAVLQATAGPGNFALWKALRAREWSLIAECKLASPAKGRLTDRHTAPELARLFAAGGAAALSVHTSAPFHGCLEDLARVRAVTDLPILRKDFIIDEYQLYESRWAGADAVLLIAALLSGKQLRRFLALARTLGLDCLVEVHSREELLRVRRLSVNLIGINNRDLTTFAADIETTFALLPLVAGKRFVISESGITSGRDARRLKAAGARGILVGEALVTASDVVARTREMALIPPGGNPAEFSRQGGNAHV